MMSVTILQGDARDVLATVPAGTVNCCVTSPPYFGLRDYGVAGQIGIELTPAEYVEALVGVFREVHRVLRDDGTLWLNLGDSYMPENRGEKAKPRKETQAGMQAAHMHSDLPTRRTQIVAMKAGGIKRKDLIGIPWMVAFALRADGWYLRKDIIWSKPNPMPESVTDRPTSAHEYIFLMSKSERYFYDAEAIAEDAIYSGLANQNENGFKDPRSFNGKHKDGYRTADKQRGHGRRHAGFNDRWDAMERGQQCSGKRNKRSVWTVATKPFSEAHFATFPPDLIEPCIKAGCPEGGMVLDPFGGAGTSGLVADRLGCNATLIELNPAYAAMARSRIEGDAPLFSECFHAEAPSFPPVESA